MARDRSGRWWYRIDALRLVIKQYQDFRFWLHQARWLSSPSNSIVPKGLRWLPRFIRGSESALRRRPKIGICGKIANPALNLNSIGSVDLWAAYLWYAACTVAAH